MITTTTIFIAFTTLISFSFLNPNNNKSMITSDILKLSSILTSIITAHWFMNDCPTSYLSLSWFDANLCTFNLSFIFDLASILFFGIALFVTWSIVEFATYYMENDPNKQSFLNTLLIFLLFMLLLVSSNNLFILFIGWEGVGILSFVLIGWWFTRTDANSAAIQAIIYNRIGDSGMLVFLIITASTFNSWSLLDITTLNINNNMSNIAYMGIIIAAAGKSAQFGLHPWLPSAMEGPTPVSALLHSSTMVVAGVFLLYRCSPLLTQPSWPLPIIALIGGLTTLFAASAALIQFDLKKIIAYSTTSQLGLMVFVIGIGIPQLALFHIFTHAFFKSLLFLCSGSLIHSLSNEQDIRKMSNSAIYLPFTTSCIIIGSLALCGVPFLAGFYSKDLILELSQVSTVNSIAMFFSLLATLMTAIYSFRVIFYLTNQNINTITINPINEENKNLYNPLLRLIIGIFISGWLISINFINFPPVIIPLFTKAIPLFLVIYAAIYVFENLYNYNSFSPLNNKITYFLANNWLFVNIMHGNTALITYTNSIRGVLRTLDQGWTTQVGPTGIKAKTLWLTNYFQNSQTGNITKHLIFLITILISILLFTL